MEDTARSSADGTAPWDYTLRPDDLARPSVLVVEDERDIRETLATLLDLAGFAPVTCDSAEAGLNALREQAFDVITDYALPGTPASGFSNRPRPRVSILDTPVLIVTAHPDVAAGPYEVIQKPFDLDDLVERVRYRLEGEGPRRRRAPATRDGQRDGSGGAPPPRTRSS